MKDCKSLYYEVLIIEYGTVTLRYEMALSTLPKTYWLENWEHT